VRKNSSDIRVITARKPNRGRDLAGRGGSSSGS
jgi:hypothetical protein